jgi:hypothetical protein
MKVSSKTIIALLIFILLLGTGLRLYRLGTQDLWLDEVLTIQFASIPWSKVYFAQLDSDAITHFLADYVIMHFWLKLGTTPVIIRLFSVLVGLGSIFVIFLIGKQHFNSQTGLLSAMLLSISSYHIYYSQEARIYAFQVFVILWMVYFFTRAAEKNKQTSWLIFSGLSIFAIYLQAFSSFTWLVLNLFIIWQIINRKSAIKFTPWIISQLIVVVACVPYFLYLLLPATHAERLGWIPYPTPQDILNTVNLYSLGMVFWVLPETFNRFFVPLFVFLLFFSGFKLSKSSRLLKSEAMNTTAYDLSNQNKSNRIQKNNIFLSNKFSVLLIWGLFAIPFILFYVISFKTPIFLANRYLIISLPFFYLLIAYGITNFENRLIKLIIVILLLTGMLIGLRAHYQEELKIRWSKVALFLEQHAQKDDLIFIEPHYWGTPLGYYLKSPIPIISITKIDELNTQILPVLKDHSRVWLIAITDWVNKTPPEVTNILDNHYTHHQTQFSLNKPSQVDITLYYEPLK